MWQNRAQNPRLLFLPNHSRNRAAPGQVEGCRGKPASAGTSFGETEERGQRRKCYGETAEGSSSGRNGHRATSMGGRRRLGFLRSSFPAPKGTIDLICGATKRKMPPEGKDALDNKKQRRNVRPVILMMLHWQGTSHPVRVLLDTGCSINLINQ